MKASQGKFQTSGKMPAPLLLKLGDEYMEGPYAILSTFV